MERYGLPPGVSFKMGERGILPDRPTLVLIHGAGGNAQNFLPQLRFLDRNLNVLALELPGHGATSGTGCERLEDYAGWVDQCLARAPWGPCILGGHSMGGAISLEVGLRYPGKVSGIIVISSGAQMGVSPKILQGLRKDPHETLVRINQWCYPKGTDPILIAQAVRLMEQTPAPVILNDFLACSRFDRREEVHQVNVPTLILAGLQDVMTPPDSSRFLHETISSSRLVLIPGAGHMVMLEKPREVNQAILEFIRGQK